MQWVFSIITTWLEGLLLWQLFSWRLIPEGVHAFYLVVCHIQYQSLSVTDALFCIVYMFGQWFLEAVHTLLLEFKPGSLLLKQKEYTFRLFTLCLKVETIYVYGVGCVQFNVVQVDDWVIDGKKHY